MTDVEIVRCAGTDHGQLQGGPTLLSNGFSERLHLPAAALFPAAAAITEKARCAGTARLFAHSPYFPGIIEKNRKMRWTFGSRRRSLGVRRGQGQGVSVGQLKFAVDHGTDQRRHAFRAAHTSGPGCSIADVRPASCSTRTTTSSSPCPATTRPVPVGDYPDGLALDATRRVAMG